ncbi:MAG: hypothetical protein DRJ47_09335 [Thermoprotei archaeon]|nr:MAG: hypothetical protein DRJ47_09335 [Thermoprotei archaeon]
MSKQQVISIIGALVVGIVLGSTFLYFFAPSILPRQVEYVEVSKLPKEIPIGLIVDLSGFLSSYGKREQKAAQLAIEDINNFVKAIGLNTTFVLYVEDNQAKADKALAAVQSLASRGVKVIIGPMSSGAVTTVKTFADSNKIIIFSHTSTAVSLAIPNDYVFRAVPTDAIQGKAIATLLKTLGIKKAAVIYLGETWGEGLFTGFKEEFEKNGGEVVGIAVDPQATDISPEVRKLSDTVKQLGVGPETAILTFLYEQAVQALALAREDPVLKSVRWFGCDGTAGSQRIINETGDVAVQVGGFLSTVFNPTDSPKKEEFRNRYVERFNEEPDPYSYNTYDAVWTVALAILSVGEYDSEKIAKALPIVAEKYFGVSGWMRLDENGDRASGDYIILGVVYENGKYVWKEVAVYKESTGEIVWKTEVGG